MKYLIFFLISNFLLSFEKTIIPASISVAKIVSNFISLFDLIYELSIFITSSSFSSNVGVLIKVKES